MPSQRLPYFHFVLQQLQESALGPRLRTRSMFGSHAIYVDEMIVFILRKKSAPATLRDNGVWLASHPEYEASLKCDFPTARSIEMFRKGDRQGFAGWLNLPENEEGFEEAVLQACQSVVAGDPRIGKIPNSRPKKHP